MKAIITQWYQSLQNMVVPYFCSNCHRLLEEYTILCVACKNHIKPVVSTSLKLNSQYAISVYALSAYEEPLRSLILAKNYGKIVAAYQLGFLMRDHGIFTTKSIDFLLPVPLHWTRYASRGFNQAALIAQEISTHTGIPVLLCAKRQRRTRFQAQLSAHDRVHNVRDVFAIVDKNEQLTNKHIMIIDDLMTTGSTLVALGKVLAQQRPASICAFVACRVI